MATILAFKTQASQPAATSTRRIAPLQAAHPSAEIVFFPGIRYERWDDDLDSLHGHDADAVAVRRDRLDVGE